MKSTDSAVGDTFKILCKRHGELATKLVLKTISYNERGELESLRNDLDIQEAFTRIENLCVIVNNYAEQVASLHAALAKAVEALNLARSMLEGTWLAVNYDAALALARPLLPPSPTTESPGSGASHSPPPVTICCGRRGNGSCCVPGPHDCDSQGLCCLHD